ALLLRTSMIVQRTPFYDPSFRHADTEAGYWALTQSDFAQVREVVILERYAGESVQSSRKASFIPEHLRMFIRYGPQTFEHDGYRRQLGKQLRGYCLFLKKKRLFRRQLHPALVEFHREAIQKISREAPDDPLVRQWMDRCRQCLKGTERDDHRSEREPGTDNRLMAG